MQRKTLLILLSILIIIGAGTWAVIKIYYIRKRNHNMIEMSMDNPTSKICYVAIGTDTVKLDPFMFIDAYPVRRKSSITMKIFNEKKKLMLDTVITGDYTADDFFLNPRRSEYILWKVYYSTNQDDVHWDYKPEFHQIDSALVFADIKRSNDLLYKADSNYSHLLNYREFKSVSQGGDYVLRYLLRKEDFLAVYFTPSGLTEKQRKKLLLHNALVEYHNSLIENIKGIEGYKLNRMQREAEENFIISLGDFLKNKDYEMAVTACRGRSDKLQNPVLHSQQVQE
jgi:hypothetical protein